MSNVRTSREGDVEAVELVRDDGIVHYKWRLAGAPDTAPWAHKLTDEADFDLIYPAPPNHPTTIWVNFYDDGARYAHRSEEDAMRGVTTDYDAGGHPIIAKNAVGYAVEFRMVRK